MGYNKSNSSDFIVYVAKFRGDVMYVGEGKPHRYLHLTSGTSHCYLANKHHFEGNPLSVEVVAESLTKEDARKREAELILELQPEWNKRGVVGNTDSFSTVEVMNINKALIKEFEATGKRKARGLILLKLLISIVDRDGYAELTGRRLKELSKGEVDPKFVSRLIKGGDWRNCLFLDEYLEVTKPYSAKGPITGYQLTQKVLDMLP